MKNEGPPNSHPSEVHNNVLNRMTRALFEKENPTAETLAYILSVLAGANAIGRQNIEEAFILGIGIAALALTRRND